MPVEIKFNADAQKALNQVAKLEAKIARLQAEMKGTDRAAKRTEKSMGKAFATDAIKQFATALVGAGGVLGALQLVRNEFEQIIRRQKEAAGAQTTVAEARAGLIRNLVGASPSQVRQVLEQAQQVSRQTGVGEVAITNALAQAVSASSGNVPASVRAVRQAARFLPGAPEAIPLFAGSLLDLSAVTNTTDPRVNQGLLSFVASLSRVVDPKQQASNIPTALVGAKAQGATGQEAVAAFAALTTALKDPEGRRSGTALIQLAAQLREFLPKGGTFGERIAAVQADPRLQRRFLSTASFEQKAKGPIEQLLTDAGSEAARTFAENLAKIPRNFDKLATLADQTVRNLRVDPLFRTAEAGRRFGTAREQLLLQRLVDAEGAVSREGLIGVLRASGVSSISERFIRAAFEGRTNVGRAGGFRAAEDILGRAIGDLRSTASVAGSERLGIPRMVHPPTTQELESAVILESLVNELRRIREATEETARAVQGAPARQQIGDTPAIGPLLVPIGR